MSNIKEEYEKIGAERIQIFEELKVLKENEIVKKYFELSNKDNELINQQQKLYTKLKNDEFSSCSHIWITTRRERDSYEARSESFYGCIKCGLDQDILRQEFYFGRNLLSFEERIMLDYMNNYGYRNGIYINELCDLSLANAIYLKIKANHPNIDDETVHKYFEAALDNIRDIKVSEKRKISRAKRLSLDPNFNKWTGRRLNYNHNK